MMDMILLGVLSLSGCLIPCSCLVRQYHYVADLKTWPDAAHFCEDTYTNMATIENSSELNELLHKLSSSNSSSEVWIGLYNHVDWRWSDGSGADYRNWETVNEEPNFGFADQLCVTMSATGRWWDDFCSVENPFVCYNGSQLDPFVVVRNVKNWSSAQRYCRENYVDLVTVRNATENERIRGLMKDLEWAWIGLARPPLFHWADGSTFSFANWAHVSNPIGPNTVLCGTTDTSGKWRLYPCNVVLPFVCYSVPAEALVSRQVVKLRIKLDSSVDVNDPAVKADLLTKLQDRLREKAGSGVTLKWREQPDGKVFHKEGTRSEGKQRKKTEL